MIFPDFIVFGLLLISQVRPPIIIDSYRPLTEQVTLQSTCLGGDVVNLELKRDRDHVSVTDLSNKKRSLSDTDKEKVNMWLGTLSGLSSQKVECTSEGAVIFVNGKNRQNPSMPKSIVIGWVSTGTVNISPD